MQFIVEQQELQAQKTNALRTCVNTASVEVLISAFEMITDTDATKLVRRRGEFIETMISDGNYPRFVQGSTIAQRFLAEMLEDHFRKRNNQYVRLQVLGVPLDQFGCSVRLTNPFGNNNNLTHELQYYSLVRYVKEEERVIGTFPIERKNQDGEVEKLSFEDMVYKRGLWRVHFNYLDNYEHVMVFHDYDFSEEKLKTLQELVANMKMQ